MFSVVPPRPIYQTSATPSSIFIHSSRFRAKLGLQRSYSWAIVKGSLSVICRAVSRSFQQCVELMNSKTTHQRFLHERSRCRVIGCEQVSKGNERSGGCTLFGKRQSSDVGFLQAKGVIKSQFRYWTRGRRKRAETYRLQNGGCNVGRVAV